MTRDPLGRAGDFITAPEISQMFGELIGLWAASVWHLMGEPENVRLVELGPGRGTMMLDALRAAQVVPAFRSALVVHLVEISPVLQQRQQQALSRHRRAGACGTSRSTRCRTVPLIVLANEFFDALPVQSGGQADQRLVRARDRDRRRRQSAPSASPTSRSRCSSSSCRRTSRDAPIGAIYEWRTDNLALELGRRVVHQGGAALVIDYGHAKSAVGETLQAVGGHGLRQSAGSAGRGRSHRARRLPGAG